MDLNKLKEAFDPSIVSWRIGATTKDKTKGIALAYIDARDVMDRLDAVCGVSNWQVKYSHAGDKTIAEIGIKINNEWVWKANGAGDTPIEANKGAISDAMKRAAVVWGVGRYLYDVQNIWVDIEPYGNSYRIKNPNDSRLVGSLEKAASGVRPSNEPTQEEKERAASQALARFITDIASKDTLEELYAWEDQNKDKLERLKAYKDLNKTLGDAYGKRLAQLSQQPTKS